MRGSHEQLHRSSPNILRSLKNRQADMVAKDKIDRYFLEGTDPNFTHKINQFEERRKKALKERHGNPDKLDKKRAS